MPTHRDPWLDNAKMGLIVLVVLGHTWALLPSDGPAGHLYDFVYLWHMPAFVFLSGYLSRGFSYRPDRLWQLVTTLLVPYVLFEGALAWFRLHVGGERLEYLWTDPHFPMWYLLALVVWRLAVPLLRPLGSGAVVLALGICLASGFLDGEWTRWMDLPRILGFLPFFVLGTMLTPERMEWLRGRTPALLGVATFGLIGVLAVNLQHWAGTGYLYYRPFTLMDDTTATALVTRLLVVGVGLAGTFAWLAVVPRVGGWFTRMGAATMIVYLFHGFAVKGLEYGGFREWSADHVGLSLVVGTALGLAIALGLAAPPVRRVLTHVADPFGVAQRKVREAVVLTAVVHEQENGTAPTTEHAAEAVRAGR
ncbi:acyltransferase family protein [Pimelobacter simplex]|uniref:Acyltransferase family protein n=1 Tax=Nocardioides simplex TaxID=2045 RepID=A0A7J5E0E2_NOCSI|nr:acyltransferase family protein [Pimelobacter simplex]KAB2811730.1 acyltransferase family protein [Pimelobacter simplex]